MIILGIETSCDETAASIFKNDTLLSSIIFSQIKIHKKFGGVVPEIASRNHLEKINLIIEKAVKDAKIKFEDIDLISVANQPGLIGSLIIGSAAAKALSYTLNIPLKTVNHIKAHIFANFIEHKGLKPPFLSLVISGGHSFLAKVNTDLSIEKIGKTRDDAIGEAYDKIARILGLPYPGGPNLEKISQTGDENFIFFKRSLIDEDNFDFSFSGIKTGVINYLNKEKQKNNFSSISELLLSKKKLSENIAASFQKAVSDVLISKTIKALKKTGLRTLVLGGGVSANNHIKKRFQSSLPLDIKLYFPSPIFSTDNAAMIAITAYMEYEKNKKTDDLSFDAYSRHS